MDESEAIQLSAQKGCSDELFWECAAQGAIRGMDVERPGRKWMERCSSMQYVCESVGKKKVRGGEWQ